MKKTKLRASDLQGMAQLATKGTVGAANLAEAVHQSVRERLGLPGGERDGETRGIAALVYQCVRGVSQILGSGFDQVLERWQPESEAFEPEEPGSPHREALLAALNGVMGDRLLADNNPLATKMSLRFQARPISEASRPLDSEVSDRVVLLVHGLCMNDLQWRPRERTQDVDFAEALLGYTPVYLRYNSGLHISQNGRELAAQIEELRRFWPKPLREISILAHSMGGLVTRSACHYGQRSGYKWIRDLKHIVFLGTPHHGAPLEQMGNWFGAQLAGSIHTAPFRNLVQLRSSGITDLRFGNLLDEDWQGKDRFHGESDQRIPLPLPNHVGCHAIAASKAPAGSVFRREILGDGLVTLQSALGQHSNPKFELDFAESSTWIIYDTSHLDLLHNARVRDKIMLWLKK